MDINLDPLFEQQIAAWPMLARGIESMRESATRMERIGPYPVLVQHIPHRIQSTTAPVDAASVAKRPCFLCAANLPPEEKFLPFDDEFSIYCNPFPILEQHVTIVHRDHRPQRIHGHPDSMLRMAKALPGHFVIYNGPACGASAPDHLHFQACSRRIFPIESDLLQATGVTIPGYGRRPVILQDVDIGRLADRFEHAMEVLNSVMDPDGEAMVNIAAFTSKQLLHVLIFPRSRHRPSVFYTGELTVSPATIDLCGVFVVPVEKDFGRITGADIGQIFEEVSLDEDRFGMVLNRLSESRV